MSAPIVQLPRSEHISVAEHSLDDISKRRLWGWGSENTLQGKKNMAPIWETIKSRFLPTTFLTPQRGLTRVAAQEERWREREMEKERERL